MTTINPKQLLSGLNFRSQKLNFLPVFLILLFLTTYQTTKAQICDKKTMVFFDTDQFSIQSTEEKKLLNLTSQFSQKTDTFLLEIYAFTDSVASVDYNYKLAQNRFKSIVAYLSKNSASHFKIKSKIWGEAAPMGSNATEEGRAKNRRVEIYYFKMNEGRIKLKGKGGMELEVGEDYFAPRGVCECNPQMMEIYTDAEAAQAGIPMTTTDGCTLTTGGMISLNYKGQDANRCDNVVIRIPGDQYDGDFEIFNAGPGTAGNWSRNAGGQLEYDEKSNYYILSVKMCPGNKINLDKYLGGGRSGNCDSSGVIAIPELIRLRRSSQFRFVKSIILTKEGKSVVPVAKFRFKGQGSVLFVDSAMSKEKIGYNFSGPLDKFVMECDSARCARLKECWCYEIPLSAYTKIIYYQKKKDYQLKIPLKYRNYSVRLYIPAADTIIQVNRLKGSKRKYSFKQPLPVTYVVLYKESNNPNNKRGYDYQVDLEKIRKKYSNSKKVYKARIKRKQLKQPV
jgi:hypothetical protein